MNILVITPSCPYPPYKTGGIKTLYSLIKHSGSHAITVLYYDEYCPEGEQRLSGLLDDIWYCNLKKPDRFLHFRSIVSRKPYAHYQYRRFPQMNLDKFDCIILDQFSSLQFSKQTSFGDAKLIAFEHDSMSLYFSRKSVQSKGLISKAYYRLQKSFSERAERNFFQTCDKVVFVSSIDAEYTRRSHPKHPCITHIELGIDIPDSLDILNLGQSLVFSGIMNYAPNEDAVLFFISEVFPLLRAEFPSLSFYVVGTSPTERIKSIGDRTLGVIVTGKVESVASYIASATVYVSPLRYGTGVKNKVLEALACHTPAVFSRSSIEGIPEINPGDNCLVAETVEEWVASISSLLRDEELRKTMCKAQMELRLNETRNWGVSFKSLIGDEAQ